jgi:4-hydroxy-3-methylbut-2-en-1-yl diphosphate reductase
MSLSVLAPLSIEVRALSAGSRRLPVTVRRIGMGPGHAPGAAALVAGEAPVLLAGFAGALSAELEPGDIVLASELRHPDGRVLESADPQILAGMLRRAGLRVHVGPIASTDHVVSGAARAELAGTGAIAVDMEAAFLADELEPGTLVTLRAVLDTPARELRNPVHTIGGFRAAYRSLRRAAATLGEWSQVLGPREVILAAPRASCAGVIRAVEIVERVLEDRGAPVYVRKQIVHNAHVVADLESRGAIFVEELDQVPPGSTAIFSAHGVSPEVRAQAAARNLDVIDATCPLVAKVHAEARRFSSAGFDIVLVGHDGHEEVEGTVGEAPARTHVIATAEEVGGLQLADPSRVAYLTQTTLAIDETAGVVDALRQRFPTLAGPASSDICYATQNRQDAVRSLAQDCDLVLVVGSRNSSNSRRLVEVAERAGVRSALVDDGTEIDPELLHGVRRIGLTAGASAPESVVQGVVRALAGVGGAQTSERTVVREDVHFKLPPEVRSPEVISCPSR